MDPREEAKRLFHEEHLSPYEIAKRLNVKPANIRQWKKRDKWAGVTPVTSKNDARLKRDKQPSEPFLPGNQCAVVTNEHTRLLFDSLTPDEMTFINSVELDKRVILKEELILLTVRERRMMIRITALSSVRKPDTNTIQRIEEALTRIQIRKQNLADQLHKIEYDSERLANDRQRLGFEGLRTQLGLAPEQNPDDGVVIVNDL